MPIADRTVLKLIRRWLQAPVVEPGDSSPRSSRRERQGTPQGGVISPLLANIYLFVVLARYQTGRLREWIEATLEGRLRLKVNRDKTRVVNLRAEGAALDFLGYTFRYQRDRYGRAHRYLKVAPSKRAVARERAQLRQMTGPRTCFVPVPELVQHPNRHLRGWSNYFSHGHPRAAFREINRFARCRMAVHLRRRSQRPFRVPEGETLYGHLQRLGLVYL